MLYRRFCFTSMALVLSICFLTASDPLHGDDGWELVRSRDGISVYLRATSLSGIKECKGVAIMEGVTLSSLLAVLDDTGTYTQWMYNCYEAKLLKKVSLYERVTYLAQKFPSGLKDRDLVNRSVVSQDAATGAVTIRVTGEPDFIPPIQGRLRIQTLKGHWILRPLKSGSVEVEYLIHMDPGGNLFAWMVNLGLPDAPYQTLREMRKIIRRDKFRTKKFSEVNEP